MNNRTNTPEELLAAQRGFGNTVNGPQVSGQIHILTPDEWWAKHNRQTNPAQETSQGTKTMSDYGRNDAGVCTECRATADMKHAYKCKLGALASINPTVKKMKITAPQLLNKAATLMEQRGAQYDKPEGERSMGATVAAFNIITGRDLTESEGWLLMQVLKDVRDRQRSTPHQDSLEDGIAYSALKAEARLAEVKV